MRFPISRLAALMLLAMPSCQILPPGDSAVDIGVKVFRSDRGEGIKELWIVNSFTGRKLELLMEGSSRDLRARFSPDKEWLAVEDDVLESFSTVRLFHQEAIGGFRRIPEEDYILGPWRDFLQRSGLAEGEVTSSASSVDSWSADGKHLEILLKATRRDGRDFERRIKVNLAGLE